MPSPTDTSTPLYSVLATDPDLREIVEMFVSEMPDRISQMVDVMEKEDWEGLKRLAHQLKGAAGSYGFEPLSPTAAELENTIADGASEEDIKASLEELVKMCRRVSADSPE